MAYRVVDPEDVHLGSLDGLLIDINEKLKEVNIMENAVKWDSLQWSDRGPHALFEEFRRVGGWNEYLTSYRLEMERRKNIVSSVVDRWQIDVNKRMESNIATNAKKWVQAGYAYQERSALARIDVGEDVYCVSLLEKKLEQVTAALGLLKAKADQFASFKNDARVAAQLMTFGNQLGELK